MVYEFLPPSVWLSLQFWLAGQLSSGIYTAGGAFELYGCCGTIIHTLWGSCNFLIYLENLSVWVSLKDGLDGHGEGRLSLTKRVGILVCHPVATLL